MRLLGKKEGFEREKIGRNELCPCGSGWILKKYHGNEVSAPPAPMAALEEWFSRNRRNRRLYL
jgi:hypothetical protein